MMFGLTLEYEVHWIGPCVAIAIYSFAIQIISTVTYGLFLPFQDILVIVRLPSE